MSDPYGLTKIKIESLLYGFRDIGINPNINIGQSEIIRFLNSKSRGGYADPLLGKKLFQVLNITNMSRISVQDFVKGYLEFEEEVRNNANIFEHKLAQEREIFLKLDELCRKYKNEQLNDEGLCENALISGEITDVNIKRKLEGIKEIILKIIYNEKIEEIRFEIGNENSNTMLHKKFEFKPKSRKDHFEFIMKGINDRDQIFDIGNKVFCLDDINSQEEYSIQIIIPEIDDEEKVAAYINAKIIVYWSDYKYYEHQRKKASKRLKKLTEATAKAKDFLLKVKEIYGNLIEKKQDIIVDFNNEKYIQRTGRRLIGIKETKQRSRSEQTNIITKKAEKTDKNAEQKIKQISKKEINKRVLRNMPKLNNALYEEVVKKPIEIPANEPLITSSKLKEIILPDKQRPVIYTHKILPEVIHHSVGKTKENMRQSYTNQFKVMESLHHPTLLDQTNGALIGINEANYSDLQNINTDVTLPNMEGSFSVRPGRWEQRSMMVKQSFTEAPTRYITRSLKPISAGVSIAPVKYFKDKVNQPIEMGTNTWTSSGININMSGNEQINFGIEQNGYNAEQTTFDERVNTEQTFNAGGEQNEFGVNVDQNLFRVGVEQSINNNNFSNNNISTNVLNLNQIGEITQNIPQSETFSSNYNLNGMNNVQQSSLLNQNIIEKTNIQNNIVNRSVSQPVVQRSIRKIIEQTNTLPTIYQNLQNERVVNRSSSKIKFEINKKEPFVTQNVLPTSILPDVVNQTIIKNNSSPVKYIDSYSEYVQNVNNRDYVNIHTIQNGNVNFNEQQFIQNVNTGTNFGYNNNSSGGGRISTKVVNIENNQIIDPISGMNFLEGMANL